MPVAPIRAGIDAAAKLPTRAGCGPFEIGANLRHSPWLMWGLAAGFYAYGFFQRVAPSVIVEDLMRELALSGALLGSLSAAYFYAYAALQIPIGVLLDRLGPRRVLVAGALLATLGSLLFAQAASVDVAMLARVLIGAGVGVGYISALKVASHWFAPERFGVVAGLTLTAGTLGAVAGQLPLSLMVGAIGWRPALMIMGAVGGLLGLAILLVLRDRPPGQEGENEAERQHLLGPLATVLRRPSIWAWFLLIGLIGAPTLTFAGLWGVPYFQATHGLSKAGAGALTSAMLLAWSLGGPAFGWLAGKVAGGTWVIAAAGLANALGWACLWAIDGLSLPVAALLTVVMGFLGGSMIIVFALLRRSYGAGSAGTAMGVVNTAVLLFAAGLQTAFGWLLDLGWQGAMRDGARIYGEAAFRSGFGLLAATATAVTIIALVMTRATKHARS